MVTVKGLTLKNEVNYFLQDPEGQFIPAQVRGNKITFSVKDLRANDTVQFELTESDTVEEKSTTINFKEDAVELSRSSGSPVFQYRTGVGGLDPDITEEVFYRGGYLHPFFTPNGRVITEHYTENRPHQNGIWTGWYKTEWNGLKPDFWSQAERTGKVEVVSVNSIKTGPVFGELKTTHHFNEKITKNSSTILSDEWTVRFYNDFEFSKRAVNIIDLDVCQTNISDHPLQLIEHVYGGVGFRGSNQWIGEGKIEFVTSEGENRIEAHQSIARWVAMSGEIDGEPAGIIILAHPDNPRFPEPVFINQREPFFTFAPLQAGDLILYPDDQFRVRYRYITLDGNLPASDEIENYWKDYTNPVKTTILYQ
jgi:phosphoribosylformylglycinamidine (FGAM) synthase PurS component